ncbi:hypothetical protein [Nostoc sp.]
MSKTRAIANLEQTEFFLSLRSDRTRVWKSGEIELMKQLATQVA